MCVCEIPWPDAKVHVEDFGEDERYSSRLAEPRMLEELETSEVTYAGTGAIDNTWV